MAVRPEEAPKPKSSLARGAAMVAVGNAVAPAAAALTTPLITHRLGVDGQGVTAAATAPLLLVTTGFTLGIPDTLTYISAKIPRAAKLALKRALIATIISGALATICLLLLREVLSGGHHQTAALIELAAWFVIPTLLLNVVRGGAVGLKEFGKVAAQPVWAGVVLLIGTLIFFLTGNLTVTSATWLTAATPLVGFIAYKGLRSKLSAEVDCDVLEQVRKLKLPGYAGRVWIGGVAGVLLMRLDQTLMTSLSGAYALGLYTVAANISEVPTLLNAALANVMFAADASSADSERLARAARISTMGVLLMAAGVMIVMIPLIGLIFGSGFRAALPATAILLAAVVTGNPGSIAGAGLSARGNPGLRTLALVASVCVNLVLLLLLVPPYGAIGAALATLAGNFLAGFLCVLMMWRRHGIPPSEFYRLRASDVTGLIATVKREFSSRRRSA